MSKILFIGNFLSKSRGTIGPIESIMQKIQSQHTIYKASSHENILIRFTDIIYKSLFYDYTKIHIDVYSGKAIYFATVATLIAKVRNKETILDLRGGGLFALYKKKLNFVTFLLNQATTIISPSQYLIDKFSNLGYTIKYIPNSINFNHFTFKKGREENFKLLWVRAFCSTYNPDIAVKALRIVKKKFPLATLTMIGPDKGELSKINNLICTLGLSRDVIITGKVPNEDLYHYYHNHQIFLTTTSYESFGVAIMEAAACGIPTISPSVGEIPYIWENNKSAILVSQINEEMYANKIIELLADYNKQLELSEEAYHTSQKFSWEQIEHLWFKLFN